MLERSEKKIGTNNYLGEWVPPPLARSSAIPAITPTQGQKGPIQISGRAKASRGRNPRRLTRCSNVARYASMSLAVTPFIALTRLAFSAYFAFHSASIAACFSLLRHRNSLSAISRIKSSRISPVA